ncbi:MAG: tetratricopeptide repeat protein [Spirochaetes bacterium]|nr:tetratricopeptide repeat protein [Spirochaetota bacterium]
MSVLNTVATLMEALIGTLALVIAIVGGLGFLEIKKWHKTRNNIEKDAEAITELKTKLEIYLDEARNKVENISQTVSLEKPTDEVLRKLDDFSRHVETLELLGASLKPEDYLNQGNDFYFKEDYESAIKAYDRTIELKPDNVIAWCNKGVALGELCRFDEALKVFEKAIELKPDYAEAWSNKGVTLYKLGRYTEALKVTEKAIELKPDYAEAWSNKGVNLSELGRYEEALSDLEKAIELNPDYFIAWSNKGTTLVELGQYKDAIEVYDKTIGLKFDFDEAWFNRACAYSQMGDKEKALSDLEKAIELNASYKEDAKKDKDFKTLWDDEEFKKLVE